MKAMAWLLVGIAAAACPVRAEIAEGDSLARVLAELGPPAGSIQAGTYHLLYYERGKVEVRDGVVTSAALMTPAELAARRAREQADRESARARAELARAQRMAEGRAELARTLSDPAYASWSAAEQVTFWREFQKRYPEVPLGAQYADALRRYEAELAAHAATLQHQRDIALLEARLQAAERRAADAERKARSWGWYQGYSYPVVCVTPPVCPPRHLGSTTVVVRSVVAGPAGWTLASQRTSSWKGCTTWPAGTGSSITLAASF